MTTRCRSPLDPRLPRQRRRTGGCPVWPLVLLASLGLPCAARSQVPEYQLKAEFLERFTRFIEWPPDSSASDPSSPFVIAVFGPNPFGRYLEEMAASRSVRGKPIKIHEISELDRIHECHILFVPQSGKRLLQKILARTESKPILTVSDTAGFAEKGVLINFYSSDDRLGFEINDAAARKSGLRVSSKLLKLARIVNLETNE